MVPAGRAANAAAVIAAAKGGSQLDLVDVTTMPTTGTAGTARSMRWCRNGGVERRGLGTRQSDMLGNNPNKSAAVDQDIYMPAHPRGPMPQIRHKAVTQLRRTMARSSSSQGLAGHPSEYRQVAGAG